MFYDGVEQGQYIVGRLFPVGAHPTVFGRAEYGGEVELVFSSVEREHEVKHHVLYFRWTAIGFVNLIDYDHGLEADFESFLKHKSCLWHRAFERVHKEDAAIGHVKHSLHFAAEVGVSRSVDYVYLGVLIIDRYVLRKDCDATFALKVVVIED